MSSAGNSPPPPDPPPMRMSASHKALAGLVAFLVVAKLIEMVVHIPFRVPDQQAVFTWRPLLLYIATALLGSGFAHVVGFPGMWDPGISNRDRIWAPLAIGIVLGVALLGADRSAGFAHWNALTFGVPSLALPFGYEPLFQLFAAVSTGIIYTLFGVAFTLWFFGTLLLSRHWPKQTFWVIAVVVSLWEPWAVASHNHWALLRLAPLSVGLVGLLVLIYVMDLAAAVLFRRFGFTAALILRVSAIFVWHILGRI